MELLYVPAGGTGRYQVNDTHLHKPMKGYAQKLASKWYTAQVMALNKLRRPTDAGVSPIDETDYRARMSNLMSIGRLHNMAPIWLDEAVKYISKPIEGEGRNLIKKGWDQLYMEPIMEEGFLEEAKKAQKEAANQRQRDEQKARFEAMKLWEAEHGSIDNFDENFDVSKVDVWSLHEQLARDVADAEIKYHEM